MKETKKSNVIYYSSLGISALIFIWAVFFQEGFRNSVNYVYNIFINNLYFVYSGLILLFFFFCLWICVSKFRKVRLGDDESKPEFSNISWFAMLFSAGIGIGIIFWGVAEPLTHYLNPPGMEGATIEAKEFALTKSFLHMGISAWACYAVLALALSYIHFRVKKPLLISSLLEPLIKNEKARRVIGKGVDILTVFATMAGIITSLGMGTLQLTSGLNYLFGIPETNVVKTIIVCIITVLFLISACTGVKKGIKYISNTNIALAIVLLVIALIVGPFGTMVTNMVIGVKGYFIELLTVNNNIFVNGEWYSQWTIFYWGWWIAWSPPVAIFIARISKGRTIGEFIKGVLFIPAGFCLVWMNVFGTLGMEAPLEVGMVAIEKIETALFMVFSTYPLGVAMSILAIVLIFTFFITSADSATYVLGMIVSNGETEVKNSKKIILGVIQSSLTLVLLFAGGLNMVQNASIIVALPYGIIMLIGIVGFTKELYKNESEKVLLKYEENKKVI